MTEAVVETVLAQITALELMNRNRKKDEVTGLAIIQSTFDPLFTMRLLTVEERIRLNVHIDRRIDKLTSKVEKNKRSKFIENAPEPCERIAKYEFRRPSYSDKDITPVDRISLSLKNFLDWKSRRCQSECHLADCPVEQHFLTMKKDLINASSKRGISFIAR